MYQVFDVCFQLFILGKSLTGMDVYCDCELVKTFYNDNGQLAGVRGLCNY